MATVKNFGLAGVGSNVQFGKSNGRVKYDTDHFVVNNAADDDFLEMYVKTPTGGSDANAATTKEYVDSVATGLDFKDSVHAGTTANLAATYNNGTLGAGATLTSTGTGVFVSTDGEPLHGNDRVLVKDQSDATENGIYDLTDLGSGGEYSEVMAIDNVGDSLNNKYWTFDDGTTSYYVWYTSAAVSDPAPGGTGINVVIGSNDTASQVADATVTAINAFAAPAYLGTAYYDSDETFHILNSANASTADVTAGDSGFTANLLVEGTGTPTAWVMTRSTDADNDPGAEVSGGMFVFIEHGDTLSSTGWVLSEPTGAAVLGTDELLFTQFSSAGIVSVSGSSNRISVVQTANDYKVDIDAAYVGQTSLTTLGTVTTGSWEATTVAIAHGGTGKTALEDVTDAGSARIALSGGATGAVVNGFTIDVNEANLDLSNMTAGSLDLTSQVSGILPVANGGTGVNTVTSNGVVFGNGTSATGSTAAGAEGQVLRAGSGGTPAFTTLTLPATIAANSIMVANDADTMVALTAVDAAGDQLLQWNDTTNDFDFVTTASVGGSKYSTITGDTGSATATGVTDSIQMVGGAGITTVAAEGTDTVTFDMDTTGLATVTLDAGVDLFFVDDGATGSVIGTVTAQDIVDAATVNIFTGITADFVTNGPVVVSEESDALNFSGGEGIVTTADNLSGVADVAIALDLNEISVATPIGTDELVFADGGATNGKVAINTFISTFLGDVLVDGDFGSQGIMTSNGAGTYSMRSIVESTTAGQEGAQVNNGSATADIEIGVDIDNLAAGTTMAAADKFMAFDGANNVAITGQDIIDGVAALGNDDRIVSPDGFSTVIVNDAGTVTIAPETTGGALAANPLATFENGSDAEFMNFTNATGEIRLEAGDTGGFGGSSTGDIDIRFVPGSNGEVIFGAAGTDATLSSSDGTDGENFVIIAGDGTAGDGGDIILTPGDGTANDGKVCITDDDSLNVTCFTGVDDAVNYMEVVNAATGDAPTFTATGTDTNIDIVMLPKGTGVLSVAGTTDYEDNVTADDDIPNRKFVVDGAAAVLSGSVGTVEWAIDLTTASAQSAADAIPAGARVMRVYLNVDTASDAATTVLVEDFGNASTLQGDTANDPETIGLYVSDLFELSATGAPVATVATPGSVGSATAIIEYRNAA